MILKLLVLVALAFSLGELRDETQVVDQISLLEVDPEVSVDVITVEHSIVGALPRQAVALADAFVLPPRSLDEGRVFRPPRLLTA